MTLAEKQEAMKRRIALVRTIRVPKAAVIPPEIALTRGLTAIVDPEDYALVSPHSWRVYACPNSRTVWAVATIKDSTGVWRTVYMHRLILGLTDTAVECDHKDGNGLNNRRENLRPATRAENARNRPKSRGEYQSRYKGVSKRGEQWFATIRSGNTVRSQACQSEIEAAQTYNTLARELHGEFARLNDV